MSDPLKPVFNATVATLDVLPSIAGFQLAGLFVLAASGALWGCVAFVAKITFPGTVAQIWVASHWWSATLMTSAVFLVYFFTRAVFEGLSEKTADSENAARAHRINNG